MPAFPSSRERSPEQPGTARAFLASVAPINFATNVSARGWIDDIRLGRNRSGVSADQSPKGALRTGLRRQSNRSPPRRNGNWKMASRDRRPKPALQGPKYQKLPARESGHADLTHGNVGDSPQPG